MGLAEWILERTDNSIYGRAERLLADTRKKVESDEEFLENLHTAFVHFFISFADIDTDVLYDRGLAEEIAYRFKSELGFKTEIELQSLADNFMKISKAFKARHFEYEAGATMIIATWIKLREIEERSDPIKGHKYQLLARSFGQIVQGVVNWKSAALREASS